MVAYGEAIRGLVDAGADLLLFETITDTLNTKAGIFAARRLFEERGIDVPIMISARSPTSRAGRCRGRRRRRSGIRCGTPIP